MTSVQNHLAAARLGGAEGVLTDDHPRIEYHRSLGESREVDLSGFRGEGRDRLVVAP